MVARFRTWLDNIKPQAVRVVIIIGVCVSGFVLLVIFIGGYFFHWDWTGFGSYTPTTKDNNFQSGKTLWDWLQLLIIPFALAIIAIFFNRSERKNERRIATDNQQEEALQAYIKEMSELLLEKGLRNSEEGAEVRTIARVRTLTVLPRLNPIRKRSVVNFLEASGLIAKGKSVISLYGCDFSEANLSVVEDDTLWLMDLSELDMSGANLFRANLIEADLSKADMSDANLFRANLSKADLSDADLSGANLREVNLRETNLSGANLRETELMGADLREAELTGADLREADLNLSDLSRADLSRAHLSGADLSVANLSKTDLRGANLSKAELRSANLSETNLENAILKDAKISPKQLKKAKSLKGATMPDGSIYP